MEKHYKQIGFDCFIILIILIFSCIMQNSRLYFSGEGTNLDSDAANIASMSIGREHRELFKNDLILADDHTTAYYRTSINYILEFIDSSNYGITYLKITAAVLFLHYVGWYIFGIILLKNRLCALILTLALGNCYFTEYHDYWGIGFIEPQPRGAYTALLGFILALALKMINKPRWWPLIMLLCGMLTYVHSNSAVIMGFAIWMSLFTQAPIAWSRRRLFFQQIVNGVCFLIFAGLFIYPMLDLKGTLSVEDIEYLKNVLNNYFSHIYSATSNATLQFFKRLLLDFPIFSIACLSILLLIIKGNNEQKIIVRFFMLLLFGILCMSFLVCELDRQVADILHTLPLEFNLVRGSRFLIMIAICIIIYTICTLIHKTKKYYYNILHISILIAFCILLYHNSVHYLAKNSYTYMLAVQNKTGNAKTEKQELIEAVQRHTEAGSSVLINTSYDQDTAIRYAARRNMPYSAKDVGVLYYSRNVNGLREYERWMSAMETITWQMWTGKKTDWGLKDIKVWIASKIPYYIAVNPAIFPQLRGKYPVLWSNARYMLLAHPVHGFRASMGQN